MSEFVTNPIAAIVVAAALSYALVWAIRPLLRRYALAMPNARSSHRVPTPQGAGIAVIAATLLCGGAFIAHQALTLPVTLFAATLAIALVGAIDDVRPIPVLPRLVLQGLCAAAVLSASGDGRIWAAAPDWIERSMLFVAILWFVNLVNFMDGLDLITASEVVPVTAALVALGWLGALSADVTLIAAALCGAMLGFAPFNKPVAQVFLGDVGSLPIGLLIAWGLIELAFGGHLVAALLLPLYYLADATLTLLRRLIAGERIWAAHRSHFYQRATTNGFSVQQIVNRIFGLNIVLAALAIASSLVASIAIKLALLLIGVVLVTALLRHFAQRRI